MATIGAEAGMGASIGQSWPERQLLITQRLRQRRAELNLTQQEIARRLAQRGMRTTNRALSALEHGAGLDAAKLPELAAVLECTVTYLVGLTGEAHRWEPDAAPARRRTRPARKERPASLIIAADVPDRSLALGP